MLFVGLLFDLRIWKGFKCFPFQLITLKVKCADCEALHWIDPSLYLFQGHAYHLLLPVNVKT